jgi:putative NIF3 family GTP cyclohydrolase 1 type 2
LAGPSDAGLGRCGNLRKSTTVSELVDKIKKALKVQTVGIIGPRRKRIKRGAVGAGSCGTLLRQVIQQGCDFYLTGELKHHHALELQRAGVITVCVGHSNSERIILPKIAKKLRRNCPGVQVAQSRKDRDPFAWC